MNHMKRLLAMLLALVMIVGVLPLSVFADEYDTATGDFAGGSSQPVDAFVVFSDLHIGTNSTDKQELVNKVMTAIKNDGKPVSSVASAGDMYSSNEDTMSGDASTVTGYVQQVFNVPVNYVWTDHDRAAKDISKESRLVYSGNYYVYLLSMADVSSWDRYNAGFYSASQVAEHIEAFKTTVAGLDKSKPLFIVGHQPLFNDRGDNGYAYQWVTAINEVAEKMDVAYFHGHNHNYDDNAACYYYAKGSTMTVPTTKVLYGYGYSTKLETKSVTLNFTHVNAGYMDPGSKYTTNARLGTAMVVTIYKNKLNFATYDSNGQYNSGFAAADKDATRNFAPADPKNVAVTGKIDYQVGDTIKAPSSVKVTYMDGNVSELAEGYSLTKITKGETEYTVEGFTFPEAGEYVLTYTCTVGNYKAQAALNVTVVAAADGEEEPEGKPEEQVKLPVVAGANVTEAKDVTAQVKIENVTNFVAYDIVAEMTGETAMVSIPVPSDWIVGELKAYYVDASGNLTDESFEVTYVDGYATFTVTHFSTYALVNTAAPVAESEWKEIPGTKTVFKLVTSLTSNKQYVIVNRNTAGDGSAVNKNTDNKINSVDVKVVSDGGNVYILAADVADTAQWTYSNSSRFVNSNRYLRGNNDALGTTSNESDSYTTWSYSNNSYGLRARYNSNYDYFRYMTSVTKTSDKSSNTNRVYIYEATEIEGNPIYAQLVADASYRFQTGSDVTAALMKLITVYTATNASGTENKKAVTDYVLSGVKNDEGTYTVTVKYQNETLGTINVEVASDPYVKITHDNVEKDRIFFTNAKVGDTVQLGILAFDGEADVAAPEITWTIVGDGVSEAEVSSNGLVTFKDNNTHFLVQASWTVGGQTVSDVIEIGVSPDDYLTPNISTNDFPEYPNEGAVRFDKTATAVGTFSETGVAKLELSMTGVPIKQGTDVIIMLDTSSSMTKNEVTGSGGKKRSEVLEASLKNLIAQLKTKDAEGNYMDINVAIADFNGYYGDGSGGTTGTPYDRTSGDYVKNGNSNGSGYEQPSEAQVYTGNKALGAGAFVSVDKLAETYTLNYTSGTNYDYAFDAIYQLGTAIKASNEEERELIVIFMSDGASLQWNYFGTQNTYTKWNNWLAGTWKASDLTTTNLNSTKHSYFYDLNDHDRDGHINEHRMANAIKGDPNQRYEVIRKSTKGLPEGTLVSAGKEYLYTVPGLGATMYTINFDAKQDGQITVDSIDKALASTASDQTGSTQYYYKVTSADQLEEAFKNIGHAITYAATNVVVNDKIDDEYTMIFGIPQSQYEDHSEKVAEALKNEEFYIEFLEYALDADHERTTSTSKLKLYLGVQNNTYYAATKNGSTDGANKFADPVFTAKAAGQRAYWSVVETGYVAKAGELVITVGTTTYKFMQKGDGTHNVTTGAYASGTIDSVTNMSQDLVIVTPYFAYSAKTRMLAWTVEKLTTVEYALTYFLYLDNSAADIGEPTETPEGPYNTNDYANITYTNFAGHECRQEFPVPKMTWNGAQVSYVFYLVNENGEPINKAGQVVDFANAVFVTDVFTESVVWNDYTEKDDEGHAYLDANWRAENKLPAGYDLFDEKAYYELLVYEDHEGSVLKNYFKIDGSEANGEEVSTTKVYNTKGGTRYSAYNTYTSANVDDSFDFSHTTVAFAVVWKMELVADTVVVDFGLDVLINVVQNDFMQNTVTGISFSNTAYTDKAMLLNPAMTNTELKDANNNWTAKVANENQIRFHQNNMTFTEAIEFYYESKVVYYEGSVGKTGYMYSTVTVIPATTIYYEDSFLTYSASGTEWEIDGTEMNNTQAQDRPGASQISAALDADNNYGYDAAYTSMSQYSMGSAHVVHVGANSYATATFTFWGTGFDIIGLTSNTTGVLAISIKDANGTNVGKGRVVDTYYGYTVDEEGQWVITDSNDPNALYQVPVMKASGLKYGKYTVTITATYVAALDHTAAEGYDLYLDAVRIYDPTGNRNGTANDAYVKDGEGWPSYTELRNLVIDATDATVDANGKITIPEGEVLNGYVFIDGIGKTAKVSDYVSYGPNNELYLAKNQSIAFTLNATAVNGSVAGIQLGIKSVGGTGHVVITANGKEYINMDVASATDMYYDLAVKDFNGKTVTITSTGDAIISLTNVKVTYTASQETEKAEAADYLLSVNANTILVALLSLNPKETIELPSAPVAPNLPVLPETPAKPVQPVKPGKPAKPGKPGLPVQPVQPVPPVQPEQPVKPVQPNKPVQPGKPGLPGSHLAVAIY